MTTEFLQLQLPKNVNRRNTISHTIITCTFFYLENCLHSKLRNVTHKCLHYEQILFGNYFLLQIVLCDKARETSASWN